VNLETFVSNTMKKIMLDDFCHLSIDTLDNVVVKKSEKGFDISVNTKAPKKISLTFGQYYAIKKAIKHLMK